jgi:AcrR family transcriptional regulator
MSDRWSVAGVVLVRSVAADAGTSRPAIYRRWPDKESLVIDAIARLAQVAPPEVGRSPFEDLVTELEHFRHCITEAAALPLAGLMLGDDVNEALRAKYHDLIVVPRRSRIRACLERAIDDGSR